MEERDTIPLMDKLYPPCQVHPEAEGQPDWNSAVLGGGGGEGAQGQ